MPWKFTPLHALWIVGGIVGIGFIVWGIMSLQKWVIKKTEVDRRRNAKTNYKDPEMLAQIAVML